MNTNLASCIRSKEVCKVFVKFGAVIMRCRIIMLFVTVRTLCVTAPLGRNILSDLAIGKFIDHMINGRKDRRDVHKKF